jgi:hypothetical protein
VPARLLVAASTSILSLQFSKYVVWETLMRACSSGLALGQCIIIVVIIITAVRVGWYVLAVN